MLLLSPSLFVSTRFFFCWSTDDDDEMEGRQRIDFLNCSLGKFVCMESSLTPHFCLSIQPRNGFGRMTKGKNSLSPQQCSEMVNTALESTRREQPKKNRRRRRRVSEKNIKIGNSCFECRESYEPELGFALLKIHFNMSRQNIKVSHEVKNSFHSALCSLCDSLKSCRRQLLLFSPWHTAR